MKNLLILATLFCLNNFVYADIETSHQRRFERRHGKPPHGVKPVAPIHRKRLKIDNYHVKYGYRFKHGYYYKGWRHRHWSLHRWDSNRKCYVYYDEGCRRYYYWCQPYWCYFPVNYCPCNTYAFPYVAEPAEPTNPPMPPMND